MVEQSILPPVCVEKVFAASCERVFDAWFDTEHIPCWMFPSEDVVLIEQDPQVGGTFNFVVRRLGKNIHHAGKYLEISRPEFFTFTWEIPEFSRNSSEVKITIEVMGEGSKLSLSHSGVLPEYEENTKTGWVKILDNLEKQLS